MTDTNFCPQCGVAVPAGSRFCPRCGLAIAAQADLPRSSQRVRLDPNDERQMAATPPPRTSAKAWLIGVPVTIFVLLLLTWAVLEGLPFGSREPKLTRNGGPPMATVPEGDAASTTVAQISEPSSATVAVDSRRSRPPLTTAVRPTHPNPAPPQPVPVSAAPAAAPPHHTSEGQLTEQGAIERVRGFLGGSNPYDVPSSCLDVRSLGFSNRGYTLLVVQTACAASTGSPHALGRWRVDTLTREVFRQRSDGRYLRP